MRSAVLVLCTLSAWVGTKACDKTWRDDDCVADAMCVPCGSLSRPGCELGQSGFCSCEFSGNTFVDSFKHNTTLHCVHSKDLTTISFVIDAIAVLVSFFVLFLCSSLLIDSVRTKTFRWDVTGLSSVELVLASLSLSLSRINQIVFLAASSHNAGKYNTQHAHIVFSVGLAFFGVSGGLVFGVATLTALEQSMKLSGTTASERTTLIVTTAKWFSALGGLVIAGGIFVCLVLNMLEFTAIVVAFGSSVMFGLFVTLARSLTKITQSRGSMPNELRIAPTLRIVGKLALRLRVFFGLLVLNSMWLMSMFVPGRALVHRLLLRLTFLPGEIQYLFMAGVVFSLASCLAELKARKNISASSATVSFGGDKVVLQTPATGFVGFLSPLFPKNGSFALPSFRQHSFRQNNSAPASPAPSSQQCSVQNSSLASTPQFSNRRLQVPGNSLAVPQQQQVVQQPRAQQQQQQQQQQVQLQQPRAQQTQPLVIITN